MSTLQLPNFMDKMIRENYSALTHQEEIVLIHMYQNGDKRALTKLINAQMKVIVKIARIYATTASPIEDCIQEATLAFPNAIMDFDTTRGMRFFTYVNARIVASIQAYTFQNDIVKIPMNHVKNARKARIKNKNNPDAQEYEVQRSKITSMSSPISNDSTSTVEDTLVDNSNVDVEEQLTISKTLDKYLTALDKNTKSWKMFSMVHGLEDGVSKTCEEVGAYFGCTRQLVSLNCIRLLKSIRTKANQQILTASAM